jgi:hypothetical protein
MNCAESKRYLDLFLDGELDVEQNLKVLEHLNLCAGCSKLFDGERMLAAEFQKVGQEKAPEALRERCRGAIDRECRAGRRRWVLSAAALVLAGVGIGLLAPKLVPARPPSPSGPVAASDFARVIAARHDEVRTAVPPDGICVCEGCTKKPTDELEAYFASRSQKTCLHGMEAQGYIWRSGAVWRNGVKGHVVCMTFHADQAKESVLSHSSLPSAAVSLTGGHEGTWDKYKVRVFEEHGRIVIMGADAGFV